MYIWDEDKCSLLSSSFPSLSLKLNNGFLESSLIQLSYIVAVISKKGNSLVIISNSSLTES